MSPHRRALLAAPLLALPALGRAQDALPGRPVRIIIPFTPAGTTDNCGLDDCAVPGVTPATSVAASAPPASEPVGPALAEG